MSDHLPTADLQAICDACLQPIPDGAGNVWVDTDAADAVVRETGASDGPLDAVDLMALHEDVAWQTTHIGCVEMPSWAYAIPVERIRTWQSFLHWSVHLMDKKWLAGTDWQMLVLRSLEPKQGAISGLRPLRPQSLDWNGIGD